MNCLFLLVLLCCGNRRMRPGCERGCGRERCEHESERRERNDGCRCERDKESRERGDGCRCERDKDRRDWDDRMRRDRDDTCECMRMETPQEKPRFDERRRGYPFADTVPEMTRSYPGRPDSCNCKE